MTGISHAEAPSTTTRDQELDRHAQPVDDEEPPRLPFPVIGVGASAGGLEAFLEFFKVMPPDSGMAFVLVQHLPPERESLIADILSTRTKMPVHEVEDGMPVEANHVYIIRPGHTMTIKHGMLHLGARLQKPGHNRPVDDFFKSLAEEQRERAIVLVLSGMGSNGTAGTQAIKAVGGVTIAQDPESAKFSSMPRHVIDAGYADFVLRPQDMPEVLLRYVGHPYASRRRSANMVLQRERQSFNEIIAILRTRTRHDFSGYKKPTILRRIERRMGLTQMAEMADYLKLLRQTPAEVSSLSDDLMIHVTGFFRDAEAWEALREKVIVPLVAEREPEGAVRCWVTACSSGEEAYTLAMLLTETAEDFDKRLDIKVFATDMAERSLSHARSGLYPGGIEAEIPPHRLERFFDKEDAVYRVKKSLRERVVFAPQNVLQDPPFSRLDICSCRNLLIYLEPEMQRRVLSLLHFGLRENGVLFLGNSETVGAMEDLFDPIDKKCRIFRRVGPTRHGAVEFPILMRGRSNSEQDHPEGRPASKASIAQITTKVLLERYTPAAVLVDREQRIVYFHGDTDPFLNQPRGEPTRDLLTMTRESLRGAVRAALQKAATQSEPVTARGILVQTPEGPRRTCVTIAAMEKLAPGHFLVSFEERAEPQSPQLEDSTDSATGDRQRLQDDLLRARDELQNMLEALQATNEELKASVEETTSVNEELQSTNEELETSKEELQSLNEELTTVNAQLQTKMEEHEATSNDLSSLLSSTDIAVIFLDRRFRIRRFTPAVKDLLDLIPADVGRPISDLRKKFADPDLLEDARVVLDRLTPVTREIISESGRTYVRRVLPYRTSDNRIDGVVLTFVDITERTRVERALREAEERLSLAQRAARCGTWGSDLVEGTIMWSTELCELMGVAPDAGPTSAEAADRFVLPPDRAGRARRLADMLARGDTEWSDEYRVTHPTRGAIWLESRGKVLYDDAGRPLQIIGIITDISERRRVEENLRASEERYRALVHTTSSAVWRMSADGTTQLSLVGAGMFEHTEPEARSGDWLTSIHPDDVARTLDRWRWAVEAKDIYEIEHRVLTEGKIYRHFLSRGVPVRDAAGEVREWIGTGTDITERKRAEELLRESEERFRLLIEGARDFVMLMLDPDGRIMSWNHGAERVLGFSEADAVGQSVTLIFTPEDRAAGAPEQELAQARKTGQATDERWHMRKDGSRLWASGMMTTLWDSGGALRGFVKVFRDETARWQVQTERDALLSREKSARRDAEDAIHVRDQFVATMSHELRTPLSAILLWAKMLRKGTLGPDRIGEGLEAIERSAEAQKQLIDDLLDTSRIKSGKLRLEMRDMDLTPLVQSAVDTIMPTAHAKQVQIDVDIEQDVGAVSADPDRLRQVIWNLLTNAVKFTPAGGQAHVGLRRQEDKIEIRVADTGKGIEPAFLGRVFAPFSQLDPASTRVHGGLGLGLAISKELVELHGGTISAESPGPGKGATFVVRLPLPEVRRIATTESEDADLPPPSSATILQGVHVLLVEDKQATRDILVLLLNQKGAQVTATDSAQTALAAYQQQRPDLIVSDIGLPMEDGYELLRRIRLLEKSEGAEPVPAIALTAFASVEDCRRSIRAGFQRHLGKPVDPEQLVWTLTQFIEKN